MAVTRKDLDRAAFVRANTRLRPVPLVPEISLHIADEATDLWQKTEDELAAIGLPPPFWAFAWAGGQALARHLLDNPDLARGARVLDLASGSGLAAIAAARAGAASAQANDIDAFAIAAIRLNAAANGTQVAPLEGDLVGCDLLACEHGPWDLVLAADIFYERDVAARATAWLRGRAEAGARVLVGDPGRAYFDRTLFESVSSYAVPVTRALEDADIKHAGVFRLR